MCERTAAQLKLVRLMSISGKRWQLTSLLTFASCVPRQEMDSLQRQMEAHAVTVHESLSSWTQGDPAASPVSLGDQARPGGDTEPPLGTASAEHPHAECV